MTETHVHKVGKSERRTVVIKAPCSEFDDDVNSAMRMAVHVVEFAGFPANDQSVKAVAERLRQTGHQAVVRSL